MSEYMHEKLGSNDMLVVYPAAVPDQFKMEAISAQLLTHAHRRCGDYGLLCREGDSPIRP